MNNAPHNHEEPSAFQAVLGNAPRSLDQSDLNNAIAEQAKTILLQKKQIEYLVGELQKALSTPAKAIASITVPQAEEETADASSN